MLLNHSTLRVVDTSLSLAGPDQYLTSLEVLHIGHRTGTLYG
jgi:hypothetical protein